jgi:hypothetical protein
MPTGRINFINHMFCVLCKVRTVLLCTIHISLVQPVSRRPLTAEARSDSGVIYVRFMVHKVTLGQAFLRVLRFSFVNLIPPVPA